MAGPKKTNNQNIYDGVFDFIWGAQKSGKNKPFPKHGDGFSGYTSSLIEIGTQPLVFPLEQVFGVIDEAIDGTMTAKLGDTKKYGLSDTGKITLSPNKLLKPSKQGSIRPRDKWAGIGGGLHYNADAALLSLYAKSNGASAQTAYKSGQLFGDIMKEQIIEAEYGKFEYSKSNPNYNSIANAIFTNKTFEEIESYNRDSRFMKEGINLVVDSIMKTEKIQQKSKTQPPQRTSTTATEDILQGQSKEEVLQALDQAYKDKNISQKLQNQLQNIALATPRRPVQVEEQLPNTLTKRDLLRIINELQREPNKEKRIQETEDFLREKGLTDQRSKTISNTIWGGNDPSNFGVYRVDRDDIKNMVGNRLTNYKIDAETIRSIEEQISRGGPKSEKMIEEIIEQRIGKNIEAKNRIANIIKDRRKQKGNEVIQKLGEIYKLENIDPTLANEAGDAAISGNIDHALAKEIIEGQERILDSRGRDISKDELISAIKESGIDFTDREIFEMLEAADRFTTADEIDALVESNFVNKGVVLDKLKAKEEANILSQIKLNDGKNIALNAILISNANEYFHKKGITNPTEEQILQRIRETRFMVNPKNNKSFGARLERNLLRYRWLTESGTWGPTLLSGKWEDFAKDSNFAKLVEEVDVKGADGKSVGKYFKSANTVAGRLFGSAYYLHPVNFLRGVFVDGSFWLKLSCDANGKLDTKRFTYFLSQLNFNKLMSPFTNALGSITNKIYGMVSPMFVGLKKFVGSLLKKILGATGVGGWIASKLIEIFSDKIAAVVNQVVTVIFYGIIAILVMFVVSFGGDSSNKDIESYINDQENIQQVNGITENIFTDSDFSLGK